MKKLPLLLALVLFCVTAAAPAAGAAPAAPAARRPVKVACVGNSITYGRDFLCLIIGDSDFELLAHFPEQLPS